MVKFPDLKRYPWAVAMIGGRLLVIEEEFLSGSLPFCLRMIVIFLLVGSDVADDPVPFVNNLQYVWPSRLGSIVDYHIPALLGDTRVLVVTDTSGAWFVCFAPLRGTFLT